jgi:hypothetical protein
MRVYINNFNLDILNDISDLFKEYMINSETYIRLYTNEGIYHIEGKKIFLLEPCDKDIKIFDNYYNKISLIVDTSFFNKQICTSVHGDTHLSLQTKKNTYQINPSCEIKMVIEYISNNDGKFIPNDIYFETEKDIDINDLFIKKEINEFLSVLN